MEWYVYYYDINGKKIKPLNVLRGYMQEFIQEIKKKHKSSKNAFAEELNKELMHRFWGRAEWEVVISAWCGGNGDEAIKIDVYNQIKLNWQSFVDYCWSFSYDN